MCVGASQPMPQYPPMNARTGDWPCQAGPHHSQAHAKSQTGRRLGKGPWRSPVIDCNQLVCVKTRSMVGWTEPQHLSVQVRDGTGDRTDRAAVFTTMCVGWCRRQIKPRQGCLEDSPTREWVQTPATGKITIYVVQSWSADVGTGPPLLLIPVQ